MCGARAMFSRKINCRSKIGEADKSRVLRGVRMTCACTSVVDDSLDIQSLCHFCSLVHEICSDLSVLSSKGPIKTIHGVA